MNRPLLGQGAAKVAYRTEIVSDCPELLLRCMLSSVDSQASGKAHLYRVHVVTKEENSWMCEGNLQPGGAGMAVLRAEYNRSSTCSPLW